MPHQTRIQTAFLLKGCALEILCLCRYSGGRPGSPRLHHTPEIAGRTQIMKILAADRAKQKTVLIQFTIAAQGGSNAALQTVLCSQWKIEITVFLRMIQMEGTIFIRKIISAHIKVTPSQPSAVSSVPLPVSIHFTKQERHGSG